VLGTSVEVCYPKENKKLYDKVLERGAIISEFPLGTHPAQGEFPDPEPDRGGNAARSCDCRGCAIWRIADYGSAGNGFGREVFALAGKRDATGRLVPKLLMKQGAKLLTNGDGVVEELPTPVRAVVVQTEQPVSTTCWRRQG
jgi:DNA processing protein